VIVQSATSAQLIEPVTFESEYEYEIPLVHKILFSVIPILLTLLAFLLPAEYQYNMQTIPVILICTFTLVSIVGWISPNVQANMLMSPYAVLRHRHYFRFISGGLTHQGIQHLALNSIALYSFAPFLIGSFNEKFGTNGSGLFVIFFFMMVVLADIPDLIKHRNNAGYSSLGASGGVAAVMAASVTLEPTLTIGSIQGFVYVIGFLVVSIVLSFRRESVVAHLSHASGIVFGIVTAWLIILASQNVMPAFSSAPDDPSSNQVTPAPDDPSSNQVTPAPDDLSPNQVTPAPTMPTQSCDYPEYCPENVSQELVGLWGRKQNADISGPYNYMSGIWVQITPTYTGDYEATFVRPFHWEGEWLGQAIISIHSSDFDVYWDGGYRTKGNYDGTTLSFPGCEQHLLVDSETLSYGNCTFDGGQLSNSNLSSINGSKVLGKTLFGSFGYTVVLDSLLFKDDDGFNVYQGKLYLDSQVQFVFTVIDYGTGLSKFEFNNGQSLFAITGLDEQSTFLLYFNCTADIPPWGDERACFFSTE
jgi:membrane associated rhomboid family serine protease